MKFGCAGDVQLGPVLLPDGLEKGLARGCECRGDGVWSLVHVSELFPQFEVYGHVLRGSLMLV